MTKALVLAAIVLGLAACGGGDGDNAAGGNEVTVDLAAQNNSGQSGTATLTAEGETTHVVVDVSDAVSDSEPAHIHRGTCADLDPAPAFGLPNVEDGRSEATVDVTLDELESGDYAINVHKSNDEADVYVSCGDIEG
jgi:hypothetical protein